MIYHKGRIKPGTLCSIDMRVFIWPDFPVEYQQDGFSTLMKFFIRNTNGVIEAIADGYGANPLNGIKGEYGNGSLFLTRRTRP